MEWLHGLGLGRNALPSGMGGLSSALCTPQLTLADPSVALALAYGRREGVSLSAALGQVHP